MEVATKKIRRLSCALPRNWLRIGRQDLSQNASRRLRLEGSPFSATAYGALHRAGAYPLRELVWGLKTKTIWISFEEFLEPKSRPPARLMSSFCPIDRCASRRLLSACYGNCALSLRTGY